MTFLPRQLILLNDDLSRRSILPRVGTKGAIDGKLLKEHHYDKIIVEHQEVFADALREAGLIAHDSELLHLGKILAIDVLFAEVEIAGATFRRFVIAEDKLFRNPEARREVLGQILDYSRALKELDPDGLAELLSDDKSPWLDANDDLIRPALAEGNFLLIVCGDAIQPRLIEYLNHLKDLLDPLTAADMALVSVAMFSNGTDHVLVPHVVGTMVKAERPRTIRVIVTDQNGTTLPANIAVEVESISEEPGRRTIELDELLSEIEALEAEARPIAEFLLEGSKQLGAEITLRAAAASVRVRNRSSGKLCTVFVITRKGTFYTGFVRRWEENAGVGPELARDYDAALTHVLGRSPRMVKGDPAGNRAIPLVEVGRHKEETFAAIRNVISVLRESRKVSDLGAA